MTPPRSPRRAGYTLLEMVVVAALMAGAAAIAIPSVRALLADGRQAAAGDQVRARLAETRSLALEQGRPYRFGFLPQTGHFQIAPEDDPAWDAVDTGEEDSDLLQRGELPEGVLFSLTETDLASKTGLSSASESWETAALYLPDGSARDDVTFYYGASGVQPMGFRVRALTGAVSAFDPAREEQP